MEKFQNAYNVLCLSSRIFVVTSREVRIETTSHIYDDRQAAVVISGVQERYYKALRAPASLRPVDRKESLYATTEGRPLHFS